MENGKEHIQRRKDIRKSRWEGDKVVGLSAGWAGCAHCSLETYGVGQRTSQGTVGDSELCIKKIKKLCHTVSKYVWCSESFFFFSFEISCLENIV